MGNRASMSSPYPEEYLTITVTPPNIMWIAQSPPEVTSSLRKVIMEYWPPGIKAERHSEQRPFEFMRMKTKANGQLAEDAKVKAQKNFEIGINPMRNSVIRFNGNPFPYDSLDAPVNSSFAFAKMISAMWQILDTFGYQQVNSGRFIKCVEASTCIFQRVHTAPVEFSIQQPNRKAVVSFEGLNRLILVNILSNVAEDIKDVCREVSFHPLSVV
ncbi:hypothetical protein Ciccas_011184 [Cichlidogyrus casuarinus]|uniref:Uncharacterized protein n=1 Tax=Cichlidogyrus casuarinus TaxID=1844966 RepID=A0ABD2PTL7_9PLAT